MKTHIYIDKQAMLSAQSNCFDVGGRLLCAAEHLQHLLKTGNKTPLVQPTFNYYNSFQFANSNDPEELCSLLIEHMKTFGAMKKRYQKKFLEQLILPIDPILLSKDFKSWKSGLPDKYYIQLYDALEKLITEKESNDYMSFVTSYENEMDVDENQRNDFDPRNYMKYYPYIRYNNDEKEKQLTDDIKNNKISKVEMKLNKNYMDNPVNQKYERDLKNKPLDAFGPNSKQPAKFENNQKNKHRHYGNNSGFH